MEREFGDIHWESLRANERISVFVRNKKRSAWILDLQQVLLVRKWYSSEHFLRE